MVDVMPSVQFDLIGLRRTAGGRVVLRPIILTPWGTEPLEIKRTEHSVTQRSVLPTRYYSLSR